MLMVMGLCAWSLLHICLKVEIFMFLLRLLGKRYHTPCCVSAVPGLLCVCVYVCVFLKYMFLKIKKKKKRKNQSYGGTCFSLLFLYLIFMFGCVAP